MCRLTFRRRFDVEVVLTPFHVPLWEALALVHSSDVFLGMHGAGFTNLLGLHKVGSVASAYELSPLKPIRTWHLQSVQNV